MSTITTINSTDLIKNSRADINANFANLNADKIETSTLDTDTTLAANSDSRIATQKAVKAYVDAGGSPNASTTQAGRVEEATDSEIQAGTDTGGTGARLFSVPSKLPWKFPHSFTTAIDGEDDSSNTIMGYTDDIYKFAGEHSSTVFYVKDLTNGYFDKRTVTTDYAGSSIYGMVIIGAYIYVGLRNATTYRVYRYGINSLSSGGTLMTIAGTAFGTQNVNPYMTSDGTNLYFNYDRMNDATNSNKIAKYSLSGTTLTFVSSTTCGATATFCQRFAIRASDSHIIGVSNADGLLRRFNTSGTLQATSTIAVPQSGNYQYFGFNMLGNTFYAGDHLDAGGATTRLIYQRVIIP